ncbi:unnamed protein product [Lymnaea stagnalis]|uniref:Uncharacterized protein n=1 Tax=Lymnaea stagnalis TaxID=6523 RepID=A0AAV2IQN4_LYMST
MKLVVLFYAATAVALVAPAAATNTDEDYDDPYATFRIRATGHINGIAVRYLTWDQMDDVLTEYSADTVILKLGRKRPNVPSDTTCSICDHGRAALVASCLPNNATTTTAATNSDRVNGSGVLNPDGEIYGRPFKIINTRALTEIKEASQNVVIVQIGFREPVAQSFCPDIPIDTYCPPGHVIFIISCAPGVATRVVNEARRRHDDDSPGYWPRNWILF